MAAITSESEQNLVRIGEAQKMPNFAAYVTTLLKEEEKYKSSPHSSLQK